MTVLEILGGVASREVFWLDEAPVIGWETEARAYLLKPFPKETLSR